MILFLSLFTTLPSCRGVQAPVGSVQSFGHEGACMHKHIRVHLHAHEHYQRLLCACCIWGLYPVVPMVTTIMCRNREGCKFHISVVDPGFEALVPAGYSVNMAFDRLGERIYERSILDFMCAELRRHFNASSLRLSLARRLLAAIMDKWPAHGSVGHLSTQCLLYSYFVTGLPRAEELMHAVIVAFQR